MDPVTRADGTVSPWVFPVRDARKRRRFRDALGRVQPVCGDRRSPGTGFFGAKLRQALMAAGIERRVTVHGLRRTFAVLLQDYLPRRDQALGGRDRRACASAGEHAWRGQLAPGAVSAAGLEAWA